MRTMKARATADNQEIELKPFVENYIAEVFTSAARTLKGVEDPKVLEFVIKGRKIDITVDGKSIELISFAKVIVADTLTATLKHLKGFSKDDTIKVIIET